MVKIMLAFVVVYLIYTWGNQEFEQSKRKNPAMYENDK
uniref:Cytochrome b-c1 complex subunit 8 n=1 Tax=Mus musculus TaxID=10090 RepID=I7HPX6_MOUSE